MGKSKTILYFLQHTFDYVMVAQLVRALSRGTKGDINMWVQILNGDNVCRSTIRIKFKNNYKNQCACVRELEEPQVVNTLDDISKKTTIWLVGWGGGVL